MSLYYCLPVVVVEKCLEKNAWESKYLIYSIGLNLFFFWFRLGRLQCYVFTNFFLYGVLYYRVQLCLAAISMLVFFFTFASQRKNDCKYSFIVFRAVFFGFIKRSTNGRTRHLHILFFLNFWKFESFKKKRKNHSVVWALLPQNCSLLFIFVHLWMKTDLIEKARSGKINYCSFMVSLSLLKQLYFIIFVCLLLILWILNSCSIL